MYATTEGIILKTTSYRDYDLILTIFSPAHGLVNLLFKGGNSQRRKKGAATSPLTCAEFSCRKGIGPLWFVNEISVIASNAAIRTSLSALEAAGVMTRAVERSQSAEQPAENLYRLYSKLLELIPASPQPEVLSASFLLKLLRHEGHIGSVERCHQCRASLKTCLLFKGESFCHEHAPSGALPFDSEETITFRTLTHSRSLAELHMLHLPASLREKINLVFEQIYDLPK